jgi:DNA-binding LacI/PurR family transcriptional regulator
MLQSAEAFDASIMKALIALRKPVAVLDGAGVFPREEKAWDLRRVRIFVPSAHQRAGRDVARYILSRGHRHAACISPFHGDAWSRVRYAGVRNVFEKAGGGVSLSLFSAPGSIKEQGPYIRQGMESSDGNRITRLVHEWSVKTPAYFPWRTSKVTETLKSYFLFQGIGIAMRQLCDQAMADPRITAWIIASDHAAHAALPYCKEKGIAIPGRIAVIGFDDAIESSELDLTSYNFNFPAAAATIVNFILHPDAGFWQHRRIVETGGRIVQRATA